VSHTANRGLAAQQRPRCDLNGTHPHGDQFVKELTGKDSALTDPGTDGFELEVGRQ